MSLVYRLIKGSELTFQEMDGNFKTLDRKLTISTTDPTSSDDESLGYESNQALWSNINTNKTYKLTDASLNNAVWEQIPVGVEDHRLLTNIGFNSHSDIDTFIATTSDTLDDNILDIGINSMSIIQNSDAIATNTQAICNAGSAFAKFSNDDTTVIGTAAERISFATDIQSSDTTIFSLDDSTDAVSFKEPLIYNGINFLTFSSTTNSQVNLTFDFCNVADGTVLHSETLSVTINDGETETVAMTSKFNRQSGLSVDVYFQVSANITGLELVSFHSYLISSNKLIYINELVGATANRPTMIKASHTPYLDTDLNKPIWYNGTDWVDATGTVV